MASRDMGVERRPITGERHGADNVPHPRFAFQFKLRRMLPSWLFAWLAGIVATAARDGKVGVLVLKRPRLDDGDALAVLRWCDWVDLHGPAKFGERAHRANGTNSSLSPPDRSSALAWNPPTHGAKAGGVAEGIVPRECHA